MTRLSYDSIFPAPIWITPHTNWHGSYDSGEIYNSDNSGTCKRVSSGARDLELSGGDRLRARQAAAPGEHDPGFGDRLHPGGLARAPTSGRPSWSTAAAASDPPRGLVA